MATTEEQKRQETAGVVTRIAGKGEEAISRLVDELARNSLVTEAIARAMSAKGRVDDVSRGALAQVGLAAADEIRELREQVERLEKRLAKLEAAGPARPKGAATRRTGAASATRGTGTSAKAAAKRATPRKPPAGGPPA